MVDAGRTSQRGAGVDRRPLGFIPDVLVGRREGRLKGIEMPALVKQSPHVEWKRACRRLFPDGTVHGRLARSIHGQARRWVGNRNLKRILDETRDRKGIVIYPPLIDWSWMRQRPQQLMIEFAKAGYLSLFCSHKRRTDAFEGFQRVGERLYLCDNIEWLYDLPNPILLMTWLDHWETAQRFRRPVVIYDYLDDLAVRGEDGTPRRRIVELHHELVTKADIVLATARRLYEEVSRLRPDALYCINGADYEHFHLTSAPAAPADIADLVQTGRPIIGYHGAMAQWFDYHLLAHAASIRKDCEFLLVGPDFDGTLASSGVADLPNVRWVGEKKYEELPSYLHCFTVATIPFLVNDITKATSPVKLFEYMAGGKPIVTTDLPECRRWPCVIVARDSAEYAAALDEAIERGRLDSYRRMLDQEARANTWEMRGRQIVEQLDCLNARKRLQA